MIEAAMPPAVIAGAVAAARGLLRLGDGREEEVLAALCRTAFALAEAFCGEALVLRPFEERVEGGEWRKLQRRPVAAITGVAGAAGALPVGAYSVDIDADGTGWVRAGERVSVTYSAGRTAAFDDLPAGIAHGVVLLAVHLFENRYADAEPPAAVSALWRPYRRMRLSVEAHA